MGQSKWTATFFRGSERDVNLPARPYSKSNSSRVLSLRTTGLSQIFEAIDTPILRPVAV